MGSSPTDPTGLYAHPIVAANNTRVLFVAPALPLPFGKADSRWQHVLMSRLPERGYDVTYFAASADGSAEVDAAKAAAEEQGWRLVHVPAHVPNSPRRRLGTFARPWSHLRFAPGVLPALAELRPETYDVVHVEHLFTSWLCQGLPQPVTYLHHLELVDWEDRDDLDARERFARVQMRRATRHLLSQTPRLIAASDRVAADAVRLGARVRPALAPVALDMSLYDMLPQVRAPVVGVIGTMHWHPSLSAARRVLSHLWPRIRQQVPEARLVVAGRGSEDLLGRYFPLDGAELLGEVPHPRDFFSRVALLLYPPPRGSGVKIKVLEAMAYGVPVVSNAEGLEGVTSDDCAVRAESDDDIVAGVVALLRDDAKRQTLRGRGREFVQQEFGAELAVDRLLAAYRELGLIA